MKIVSKKQKVVIEILHNGLKESQQNIANLKSEVVQLHIGTAIQAAIHMKKLIRS